MNTTLFGAAMARNIIDIGVEGNDGTGDSIRESFRKSNENFQELYAVFGIGGQINFTTLGDTPDTLAGSENKVPVVNPGGTALVFKSLVGGNGINVVASGSDILITNTATDLSSDPTPQLTYHLNAQNQMIGYLKNPDTISVGDFNTIYGTSLTPDDFAFNRGYADSRYINTSGDTMLGYLNVPAGASGSQTPRMEDVIARGGSVLNRTMIAPLYLSDHPGRLEGRGSPNGIEDLQAATKYYVDNSSWASSINLYVSTSGDDLQTKAPDGLEGRWWTYAYRSIGAAAERAEQLIEESPLEPGVYRQLIAYNGGAAFSTITEVTTGAIGTTRIKFTNDAGSPVDQGDPENTDLSPGKIVQGRDSGATGIIYYYYGADPLSLIGEDYFDLENVSGNFFSARSLSGGVYTYSGTTITVTKSAHGLQVGQTVTISGATATTNPPNGSFVITEKPSANTFKFVVTNAPTGSAGGSLTISANGENLDFGPPVRNLNITIFVESGIYEEHFPIRLAANVAIVGDEFRRTIVRPIDSPSKSRWADLWFYRDISFDGLTITTGGTDEYYDREGNLAGYYGYHYLIDPTDRNSTPKNNKEIDVFLCNEANIVRQITCQGHGGFMMVLDPEGQIFTKSPYCQQSGSFSGSLNKQRFAGGQYVDGFNGNLPATPITVSPNVTPKVDNFNITVTGFGREPQVPTSFFENGVRFKINTYRSAGNGYENAADLLRANKEFIKAQSTAYIDLNYTTLPYDEIKCRRDSGLILDAVAYDMATGTNYNSVIAGLAYQRAGSTYLQDNQNRQTIQAIEFLQSEVEALPDVAADPTSLSRATAGFEEILDIFENGVVSTETAADTIVFPEPALVNQNRADAKDQIQANRDFIIEDVIQFINNTYPLLAFNETACRRDLKFILNGLTYDILYGGNSATQNNAKAYYENNLNIIANEAEETAAVYGYLGNILSFIVRNQSITPQSGNALTQNTSFGPATAAEAVELSALVALIQNTLLYGLTSLPGIEYPSLGWVTEDIQAAFGDIISNRTTLVEATIQYLDDISLKYKKNKSARDVGLIIDAVAFDLKFGGNSRTIEYARKYWIGDERQLPDIQTPVCIDTLEYVSDIAKEIVQNLTVLENQTDYDQITDLSNPGEALSVSKITTLFGIVTDIIDNGLTATPGEDFPIYQLVLDNSTPYESAAPALITLLSAGNTSMLSNDWTQLNDWAYGLIANNNGLIETVSVFTYYCYTAYYAKNGGQIRSVGGSNCNGVYGLVAEGADVLEIPDPVTLLNDQVQVAKIYKRDGYAATGLAEAFEFYIDSFQYIPYGQGFIDINHGPVIGIKRYPMASVSDGSSEAGPGGTPVTAKTVIRINLTNTNVSGLSSSLADDLTDGQFVTLYTGQQQVWYDVKDVTPTRPSTSLTYLGDSANDIYAPVYRVINYSQQDSLGVNLFTNVDVSSVTQSNPAVVTTSVAHGFSNGDRVRFLEIDGMTELNDNDYYITLGDAGGLNATTKFRLYTNKARTIPVDSTLYVAYTPGSVGIARKNGDLAYLETDDAYNYIVLTVDITHTSGGFGSAAGDTKIAVEESFSAVSNPSLWNRLNTGEMLFAWDGKVHRITSYTQQSGWGYISFADTYSDSTPLQDINAGVAGSGLQTSVDPSTNASLIPGSNANIYIGLKKDEPAEIVTRISTCRVTSHDFLDIGTGGYNQSNYPSKIYGPPSITKDQDNEVDERSNGRVFYASTDQDGFFRVGRFFSVDQGTGTVGIDAGRIALEGITALKFKRGGARVNEFSTDSDFTLANDEKVPTQLAVQNYINKRLGKSENGLEVNTGLIGGAGFLDANGVNSAVADINFGGNKTLNVATPTSGTDGANKNYVDSTVALYDEFKELRDVLITSPAIAQVPVFPTTAFSVNNATVTGDLGATVTFGTSTTLASAISILGSIATISLTSAAGFPGSGHVRIDNEIFGYSGISSNTLTGVTRGLFQTTAATHSLGATVGSLSSTQLNLQLVAGTIVDADINSSASITQTKLNITNSSVTGTSSLSVTATGNGTTATLTFSSQAEAPFAVGARIVVSGLNVSGYNGVYAVTACTTTTVSYLSTTTGAATGGTVSAQRGLSVFDQYIFTNSSGYISLRSSTSTSTGIPLTKVQYIGNSSILGNLTGSATYPRELTPGAVVSAGDGIKNASFTTNGAMTVTAGTPNTYSVTAIATDGSANTLVRLDASGHADVQRLKIRGYQTLDVVTTTLEMRTPGTFKFLDVAGNDVATTTINLRAATTVHANFSTNGGSITSSAGVNGTVGNFTTEVRTPVLTTGATATAGTVTGNWALSAGSRLQATYADLAEYYEGDQDYEPGTVLVFGGDKEVTVTTQSNDRRVAGVVSDTAAYVMNTECPGVKICVALQGRVPVKVVGKVRKGDMLVTSAKSGYAVVNNDPRAGTVIGKALVNKDDLGEGIIEVAIGRL